MDIARRVGTVGQAVRRGPEAELTGWTTRQVGLKESQAKGATGAKAQDRVELKGGGRREKEAGVAGEAPGEDRAGITGTGWRA